MATRRPSTDRSSTPFTHPAAGDPNWEFLYSGVRWIRADGMHTAALPGEQLPQELGASVLRGYRLASPRYARTAYVAFLCLFGGTVALMAADGFHVGASAAIGQALFLVSGILVLAAVTQWRRARRFVTALFVGPRVRSTWMRSAIETNAASPQHTELVVVAREGFTLAALGLARAQAVRCLEPLGNGLTQAAARTKKS